MIRGFAGLQPFNDGHGPILSNHKIPQILLLTIPRRKVSISERVSKKVVIGRSSREPRLEDRT